MIKTTNLSKKYNSKEVLNISNLSIPKGQSFGLVGNNGAGKTTLFNIIAGNLTSDFGEVFLEDENISGLKAHELFNKKVLRTFQIAHEFSTLTVLENLMMVPANQYGENLIHAWFNNSLVKKQEEEIF